MTENITDSFNCSRLTNSRRRVSRAQIGANSGHVRQEQRFTSSGIGRPQLQRWKRRPRRVADAIAARAPASLAAFIASPCPAAVLRRSPARHQTRPGSPESVQPQSENELWRVKSAVARDQPEGPARAAQSRPRFASSRPTSCRFRSQVRPRLYDRILGPSKPVRAPGGQ